MTHSSITSTLSAPLIASNNEICKGKSSIDLIIRSWAKNERNESADAAGHHSASADDEVLNWCPNHHKRDGYDTVVVYVSCFDPPGRPTRTSAVLQNDLTCVGQQQQKNVATYIYTRNWQQLLASNRRYIHGYLIAAGCWQPRDTSLIAHQCQRKTLTL